MSRRSVFDRLGPCNEDTGEGGVPPPLSNSARTSSAGGGLGPPHSAAAQRVALAHPLVSRQLRACLHERQEQHEDNSASGVSDASQTSSRSSSRVRASTSSGDTAQQQRQQQRQNPRKGGSAAEAPQHGEVEQRRRRRQQPLDQQGSGRAGDGAGGDAGELRGQLERLQAERDAADEMLAQMVQQAQALMAEKAALQRQAAELEAQKAQLEERLEYLLPGEEEDDEVDWTDSCVGSAEDGATESDASSYLYRPHTPVAAAAGEDALGALPGRLDKLALKDQDQ